MTPRDKDPRRQFLGTVGPVKVWAVAGGDRPEPGRPGADWIPDPTLELVHEDRYGSEAVVLLTMREAWALSAMLARAT